MAATTQAIQEEKARLYETANIRDDLNDAEAEVLLKWAEGQVERLAQGNGDFEQQNRFLRQLLARIDRFVGQRQYMDEVAHAEGMTNLMKMLAINGYSAITKAHVLTALPTDKANMRANLDALLHLLTPVGTHAQTISPNIDAPTETMLPVVTTPTRSIEDPTATPAWLQAIVERVRAAHDPTESPDNPNPRKQGE